MDLIIKRIPLLAFCLYLIKISILGAYTSEVCILAILTSMACFFEYKVNSKEIKRLEQELDDHKKLIEQNSKELNEVKVHVTGIKMNMGLRVPNVNKVG